LICDMTLQNKIVSTLDVKTISVVDFPQHLKVSVEKPKFDKKKYST